MPNTSISFPANPAVNQQYTYGTTTYVWTGTNWMTYIDSASLMPTNPAAMNRQLFSGTGAQTQFTLASNPGALGNGTNIYINGIYQQRNTYTISNTTLTFSAAPPAGTNNIEVVNFVLSNVSTVDSSFVTYLPTGTGAVTRSASSKFGDTVSVKDFGAVGDGVANDTAAIQLALNSSAAEIHFPTGTYLCNSTISVPSDKRLFGSAKLKLGAAGQRLLRTASNVQNCVFEDLELEGFSGPGGGYVGGEFGIQLDEADWCVIRNVTAYNFGGDGFYVGPNTANNNLVENCVAYNNGRHGCTIAGGAFNVVRGGYYYDNVLYGVDLEGPTVSETLVDGVTAWGNVNGVNSESGTLGKAIITNCRCYSNTEHGIQSNGIYDKIASNVCYSNTLNGIYGGADYQIIDGNHTYSNLLSGIVFDPGLSKVGLIVSQNVSYNNTGHGIQLSRIANSVVDGNYVWDNDNGDSSTWSGISLGGSVVAEGRNNIISNNISGNTTAGVGQRYGVYIGPHCPDNIVSDNVFFQNKDNGFRDDTTTGNTVVKNKGYLNENGGTSAAISSGGTIAHGLEGTPTIFSAVPTATASDVQVTADATNLTVTFGGGGSVAFSWRAAMQNSM